MRFLLRALNNLSKRASEAWNTMRFARLRLDRNRIGDPRNASHLLPIPHALGPMYS